MRIIKRLRFVTLAIFVFSIASCTPAEDANMHLEDEDNFVESKVTSAQYQPDFDEYSSDMQMDSTFFVFDMDTSNAIERTEFDQMYRNFEYKNQVYKNEFKRYYSSWLGPKRSFQDKTRDTLAGTDMETFSDMRADAELSREELFTRWDLNNDNSISQQEYMKGMFNLYDRDKSGRLEYYEFSRN